MSAPRRRRLGCGTASGGRRSAKACLQANNRVAGGDAGGVVHGQGRQASRRVSEQEQTRTLFPGSAVRARLCTWMKMRLASALSAVSACEVSM